MAKKDVMDAAAIQVAVEFRVAKPRAAVWKSIVEEISFWWPADFCAAKNHRRMVLEPYPGGRLYEEGEGGGGVLWYTVIAIEPLESLNLAGFIAPPFGGPATSLLRITLEEASNSATTVKILDSVFGRVDEGTSQSVKDGWTAIFSSMKSFADSKK
jgi:uncharacterized protein YndB with AHSA1/START domain